MENYESLGTLGEGTYGVVIKARHKDTGQLVAIKKFKESDEDEQTRKTALREVRILKQLKHDNIVNLVEVFRRRGKLYLVFEYVERTILEELENHSCGLSELEVKKYMYQLVKGVQYCHENNIIHRDIKPENILLSKHGILKLCDFGFARTLAGQGAKYTDYVATRWYRAPELLVGDTEYGKAVDMWAVGSNAAELSNGIPLFPGESDIDQLFHIIKCFGRLTPRHVDVFKANPLYAGIELPKPYDLHTIDQRFLNTPQTYLLGFLHQCLHFDPDKRGTCFDLLSDKLFTSDGFNEWYDVELQQVMSREHNPLIVKKKKSRRTRSEQRNHTPMSDLASTTTGGSDGMTAEESHCSTSVLDGMIDTQDTPTNHSQHRPSTGSITELYNLMPQETDNTMGVSAPGVTSCWNSWGVQGNGTQQQQVTINGGTQGPTPTQLPPTVSPPPPGHETPGPPPFHPTPNDGRSNVSGRNPSGGKGKAPASGPVTPSPTDPDGGPPPQTIGAPTTGGMCMMPPSSSDCLDPHDGGPSGRTVDPLPHLPSEHTTFLHQGGTKKDNPHPVSFPQLGPFDPNPLLKYNGHKKKQKKGDKGANHSTSAASGSTTSLPTHVTPDARDGPPPKDGTP